MTTGDKPQGVSGALAFGPSGASFEAIKFPELKADREALIAGLFVLGFEAWVAMESEPSLKPFNELKQNPEADLDFTIATSQGMKSMELVEFAPLETLGPKFADAPASINPKEKSQLAFDLIQNKSAHQGGDERFLVIYNTEHGFWLDPITIERLRRLLKDGPPSFDRVYYVSVHNLGSASVSEIFPGTPHHWFGEMTNEQMDDMGVQLPHPKQLIGSAIWSEPFL